MLTFAQLLREYIGERTLEEVAELCAGRGLRVDPTYISKWRTGNRRPPDDERVIRTLAEACGRDPEPLVLLATMERHPERVFAAIFEALGVTDGDRSGLAGLSEFARRVAALPPVPAPSVEPAAQALRDIIRTANDALAKLKAQTTDAPA